MIDWYQQIRPFFDIRKYEYLNINTTKFDLYTRNHSKGTFRSIFDW